MQSNVQPVQRPLWMIVIAIVIGSVAIAGILAGAQYVTDFYGVVLFPVMMGISGGAFGALLGLTLHAAPWKTMLAGVVCGWGIYLLYRWFEYLLFAQSLETSTPLSMGEYLNLVAEMGLIISRSLNSDGFTLSESLVWAYWGLEVIGIAIVSAWGASAFFHKLREVQQQNAVKE